MQWDDPFDVAISSWTSDSKLFSRTFVKKKPAAGTGTGGSADSNASSGLPAAPAKATVKPASSAAKAAEKKGTTGKKPTKKIGNNALFAADAPGKARIDQLAGFFEMLDEERLETKKLSAGGSPKRGPILAPSLKSLHDAGSPPPPPPPQDEAHPLQPAASHHANSGDSSPFRGLGKTPPPPPPLPTPPLPTPPPPPPSDPPLRGSSFEEVLKDIVDIGDDFFDLASPEPPAPVSQAALALIRPGKSVVPEAPAGLSTLEATKDAAKEDGEQRINAFRGAVSQLSALSLRGSLCSDSSSRTSAGSNVDEVRSSNGSVLTAESSCRDSSGSRESSGTSGSNLSSGPKRLGLSTGPARRVTSSLMAAKAKARAQLTASGSVQGPPMPLKSLADSIATQDKLQPMEPPRQSSPPLEDKNPEKLADNIASLSLNPIVETVEKPTTAIKEPVDLGGHGAWRLVALHLDTDDAVTTLPCVNRNLHSLSTDQVLLASLLGCLPGAPKPASLIRMQRILKSYPKGKFLAEGGYKRVFRVESASARRTEAMSILDLQSLRKRGLEVAMGTELWVAYLLSQIAQQGRCPHFLQLYNAFKSDATPEMETWDLSEEQKESTAGPTKLPDLNGPEESSNESSDESIDEDDVVPDEVAEAAAELAAAAAAAPPVSGRANPRKARKSMGAVQRRRPTTAATSDQPCFQYVLMEFADGGDMEEACKSLPKMMWPVERLPCFLYQMLFALYSAQQEIGLRHYDVKLLNFFLRTPTPANVGNGNSQPTLTLHYGCLGAQYEFQVDPGSPSIACLADFGTSDISPANADQPIGVQHFTTLENTPPDFLLLGTRATQSGQADAFALGLCWLHLLTGRAPYEELLENLTCPADLRLALDEVWRAEPPAMATTSAAASKRRGRGAEASASPAREDVYKPIRKLLSDEDEDEESVLHTTLYRFLCLFGSPEDADNVDEASEDETTEPVEADVCDSAAWRAVRSWLQTPAGKSRFAKDRSQWSAYNGKAKPLVEAQRRMAKLPGSAQMLKGLTCFHATRRWSVRRALQSELFAANLCEQSAGPSDSVNLMRFVDYLAR